MQILVTDKSGKVWTVDHTADLTINGKQVPTIEMAVEEIDRLLGIANTSTSQPWHTIPMFFRTDVSLLAFDSRNVSSYEIVPDPEE
jgi:hypothetical protein